MIITHATHLPRYKPRQHDFWRRSAGGAIGWQREYRLAADGSYTFSAYPSLSAQGAWHQRVGALAQLVLEGTSRVEGVGLVRDPDLEPSQPGVLRSELVQVIQLDTPPPPPASDVPQIAVPPVTRPPRTSEVQVSTDAEGALELALEPWTKRIVVIDRRQRHVTIAL